MSDATAATTAPRGGTGLRRVLLAAAALAALVALGRLGGGYLESFATWVEGLGFWGPLVFGVGYALATMALVPASLLTLAAGAIFGVIAGAIYVFFAAVAGSAGAFLLARHGARRQVEERFLRNPRFAAIDRAIADQGARIVFLLRLSPVFPFVLLNYALGLTKVSLRDYLRASLGMVPGTLLYVYYGSAAREVAQLAGGQVERGAEFYAVWGLGLVATVVVTAYVTRIARRALREATGE